MPGKAPRHEALEAEIRRLPDLSLAELRDRWKTLYGNPAPRSLRRSFLAKAVAYQMQVEAYGGLSNSTKRRLREIAEAVRRGNPDVAGVARKIKPGTQMIRQWQDTTHVVTVTAEGFEWDEKSYKSLSAIAKQITGTNWNGYVFFGIKRAPTANKNAAGSHRVSTKKREARARQSPPRLPESNAGRSHA